MSVGELRRNRHDVDDVAGESHPLRYLLSFEKTNVLGSPGALTRKSQFNLSVTTQEI